MFKIGDFSQLAQVSVWTLRLYDELGLLKPAQIECKTSLVLLGQFGSFKRVIPPSAPLPHCGGQGVSRSVATAKNLGQNQMLRREAPKHDTGLK